MATVKGGISLELMGVGSEAAHAAHMTAKPVPYSTLGSYSAVLETGTIGAGMAALGEIMQMRWVDTTRFCVITEVSILEFRNVATAWTAGRFIFGVWMSSTWTADGTGGSAVTVTTPQLKLRKAPMGASLFSTGFRIATTAALGAGTKTLDTLAVGAIYGRVDAVAAKHHIPQSNVVTTESPAAGPGIPLFKADVGSGEHPIVLEDNEGISVRATVPATGTWQASILVKWSECAAY